MSRARLDTQDDVHLGLDGPCISCPAHPDGCPPSAVLAGVEYRRWPGLYVTPRVHTYRALHRRARGGAQPLTVGSLSWPAPLATAFDALDHYAEQERIHREVAHGQRR